MSATKQQGHDLTANADVSLLVTVYPPYSELLNESIPAIEQYWPEHPPLIIGQSKQTSLPARMLTDLREISTEYVVVMHEDLRLCGPVKQEQFNLCLDAMRSDPSLASCSLTWEPSNTGIYHHPKLPYKENFQEIQREWNYIFNFQARIWRGKVLAAILSDIPPNTNRVHLEPLASLTFCRIFPNHRAITYAFPDPPAPSTFVDATDKSAWIVPFDNLIHAGKRRH